jgi:hypothetical protein
MFFTEKPRRRLPEVQSRQENSESSIRRQRDDKEDRRGTKCGRPEFGETRFGR